MVGQNTDARPLITLPCQPPLNGLISITVRHRCTGLASSGITPPMKYWEMVADKLSAAGFSWGYCSAVTRDLCVLDCWRPSRRSPLLCPFRRAAERISGIGTNATV